MKITVIVPAYNVADYIEKCIESLMQQTMPFYEILVVDDGSSDGTGAICDRLAEKYSIVKVFHQENKGASAARNYGIDRAQGDYIMFVDADDVIEPYATLRLSEALGDLKVQVIAVNALEHFISGHVKEFRHHYSDNRVYNGEEYALNEHRHGTMRVCLLYYLFSLEYLNRIALRYVEGHCCEDEVFVPTGLILAESVLAADVNYYHHMKRVGSLTYPKNALFKAQSVLVMCEHIDSLSHYVKNEELRARLLDHALDIFYQLYVEADMYHHKDMRLGKEKMKIYASSKKNKVRNALFFACEPLFSVLAKIYRKVAVRVRE